MNTTKENLLQKGAELFLLQGYHATGIGEITNAIDVSKGSFYNHFKKKEKFVVQILDDFGTVLAKEHTDALSDIKYTPFNRIVVFYEEKINKVIHSEQFLKGCLISNMCQEIADKSDMIAQSIDKAYVGMHKALKNCLEEAKKSNQITDNVDTDLMAEFIINSWNGALMRVKASRNSKALDAFLEFLKSIRT
ncbi:TetR/AcrR family transcriptional regulator [Seonamhaeicola marinus]|uniref:TetR family transcriptional regulator n=1 Tax=Seonamhaeicola marinus TaxID=1912246 RepID=A0A5D0HQ78_9FLAO|nr:TetR/AcrR family transcriptional regulator [Seonamhaeicola marinus]TYA71532.1 TetR family transcriptional regulator [Seonamhaeicola marinus]